MNALMAPVLKHGSYTLALLVLLLITPWFVRVVQNPVRQTNTGVMLTDLVQDYASARNYYVGRPIYTTHNSVITEYLMLPGLRYSLYLEWNAHPPTSVLCVLPLGRFSYRTAFLLWTALSLAVFMVGFVFAWRALCLPFSKDMILPLIALIMIGYPVRQQIQEGQFSFLLFALITSIWGCERAGLNVRAGIALGLATAIKLFPGILFLYYLYRRKWLLMASALSTLVAMVVISAGFFGIAAYYDYWHKVIPQTRWFAALWENSSILGFWTRLFNPAPEKQRSFSLSIPLAHAPGLAYALTACCVICVILIWIHVMSNCNTVRDYDIAFCVGINAGVVISPVTWPHYYVLLLLPALVVLREAKHRRSAKLCLVIIMGVLWIDPNLPVSLLIEKGAPALPTHLVSLIGFQFYGLVTLLLLLARLRRPSYQSPRVGE